jgi:hypothetical protein
MIIKNFINGQITTGTEPIDPISGVSRGLYINSVLSGNSTSDTLVGLDINPSYSGIAGNYFGLRVSGDTIFATTGGTQVFNTSSKDSAVIVGSADFGAYFQVTSKSRTASPGRSSAEFVIGNYNDSKFSLFSYDGASAWTERFRLVGQTGNVLIGTTTDAGFKLDVNGDTRIKGAGATSGTTGFTVVNSSNEVALQVLNNKWIGMQVLSPSAPLHVYYPGTTPQTKTIAIFDGYQSPAQPEMQIQVGTVTNNFASFFGHKTDMGGFVKTIASSTFAITWDNTSNLGFGGSPVANNTVTIYPRNFSNTSEINTTGAILRVATGSIQIVPQTATPDTSMVGLGVITLNSNVIAKTYTNAINLYIDGPPVAGNNTTITNRWSMYVNSGNTYFGGRVMVGLTGDTGFQFTSSGSTLLRGSGTTSSSSALTVQNSSGGTLLNLTNNGNLNVDNGALYVDGDNGRVGFGTTSPTSKLQIVDTSAIIANFGSTGSVDGTILVGNGTDGLQLGRQYNNGQTYFNTVGNATGGYSFRFGGTEKLSIDISGNTTFSGTLSMAGNRSVQGLTNNSIYVPAGNGGASLIFRENTNGKKIAISSDINGNTIFYNEQSNSNFTSSDISMYIVGSTKNVLIGTTTDNGAKLRIEGGDLSMTGYQPQFNINGTSRGRSYIKTDIAIDGTGVFGGIGMNTDIWLTPGAGSGGYAGNFPATIHFKVNGTNPLTSATSHWLAGDNGKNVGYEFLTTHYRLSVPAAWYGPEISGGIVGLQQFNIGYEPKQYAGAGFTFVGVGLSGVITDPFTRITEFNPIRIDYSLASGGSNITTRGFYYNPTFTSAYPLLVNNAFESTSGSLVLSGVASRVSSTISRGAYFNQTLRPVNMTGDTLIGLDINPTFTSSSTQISTFGYTGGTGYSFQTVWTNIPLTGGTGSGATVNITIGSGNLVTAVTMANRGTGYTVNDILSLPSQNMLGGLGFSITVTAVGASTYDAYGLIVRSGKVTNTTDTPPTGFQSHTAGSNSLYWKVNSIDKYVAIFENTSGYGDGVLIKVGANTHSGLLVTSNNATLLEVSDDVGGIYSPRVTSGGRVAWGYGYVEHAGGVGTNIYGNGPIPFITLREYSYNVLMGTTTDLGFKLSVSGSTLLRGSGTTSASYALATQNSSGGTTMVVNNAGNMLIGTTTDAGQRLQVNGSTRIIGVGSTSGTTSFLVQNSSGTENLKITDDSTLFFKGSSGTSLRIRSGIEANSSTIQFNNDGLGGGYNGGYTFTNGFGGNYGTTVSLRIYSGKVAIGNVSEPTLQNTATNLYVDNTQTGGRNAAIKLNVNFANITTEYNGIQFDTIENGAGGAFIGSQHNPLTNGYGADFVVLATSEAGGGSSYTDIARFVGKSQSLSLGAGKTPTAKLHLSGSSGSTLFEIDSNSYQNILNVSGLGNVLIGTNTNNNSRLLVGGTVSGATLNTTRGVHVAPTLLATGNTTTLIGLDIQPTFTPGSFTGLTQIALRVSGGTQIIGSGSTGTTLSLFSVDGASGRLFDVTDDFTNSLFSVNTSSGVPVIEAFANNSIVMGTYGSNALVVSGTSVSIGTSTSNSTSVLNIVSTTKGVQFPRMTTAQKNSLTGAADILGGLVVFDTNTNKLCCYNGTTWNDLF